MSILWTVDILTEPGLEIEASPKEVLFRIIGQEFVWRSI